MTSFSVQGIGETRICRIYAIASANFSKIGLVKATFGARVSASHVRVDVAVREIEGSVNDITKQRDADVGHIQRYWAVEGYRNIMEIVIDIVDLGILEIGFIRQNWLVR